MYMYYEYMLWNDARERGRASKASAQKTPNGKQRSCEGGWGLAKLPCRRGHRSDPLVVAELRGSADCGEVIFEIRWLAPAVFQI